MRVQLLAFVALAAKTVADGLFVDVMSYLYRCRERGDLGECVERDLTRAIDRLMDKNGTYRLNRYLTVSVMARDVRGGGDDDLPTRVADLFNALRVRYRPEVIADDFESRKKKKKGGKHGKMGMLMASGAMLMSVVGGLLMKTKMHLALLIAVKALIMAKLALLLAGAVAMRKLLGGGGGGGGVQPAWNSGGGAEQGGYRRSHGFGDPSTSMAYREQLLDSYDNHQT